MNQTKQNKTKQNKTKLKTKPTKQNKTKLKTKELFSDKKRCMDCPIFFSLGVHLDISTSSELYHCRFVNGITKCLVPWINSCYHLSYRYANYCFQLYHQPCVSSLKGGIYVYFYGCFNRNFTFLLSPWGVTLQGISLVIEQAVVTKTCTYLLPKWFIYDVGMVHFHLVQYL